jgi:hypothetical protein
MRYFDVPPNFLKDPNVGPKVKQRKKKIIEACSLTCNTLGVEGMLELWDGLGQTHKQKFKMKSTYATKERRFV